MNDKKDSRWSELLKNAGIVEKGKITEITVKCSLQRSGDDVVMCPPDQVETRLASLKRPRPARAPNPERTFLARALRTEAEVATALLIRAVIGTWVYMRGETEIKDPNERRVWSLIESQLILSGQNINEDVIAGRRQIQHQHIQPPVDHSGPEDVVIKAMKQIKKQISGRHLIVMGKSPLAA